MIQDLYRRFLALLSKLPTRRIPCIEPDLSQLTIRGLRQERDFLNKQVVLHGARIDGLRAECRGNLGTQPQKASELNSLRDEYIRLQLRLVEVLRKLKTPEL